MYRLLKSFLFLFNPEKVHYFTLNSLKWFYKIPFFRYLLKNYYSVSHSSLPQKIGSLEFPNPVGLAAGLDKNGDYIDELSVFGFGFIEIGTVTPLAQLGNPKPRLFRLIPEEALINRMGFNNHGVESVIENLKKRRNKNLIIGGNIGKNKDTPNEMAWKDFLYCWDNLYPYVDYFVVNVSSPNTPNLRALQEKEPLKKILSILKNESNIKERKKPILLKIAPDLNEQELDDIVEIILELNIDGLIATNTTLKRPQISEDNLHGKESGGLSGKPLGDRSTQVIRYIHQKSQGKFPIIGVGGIDSPEEALEKIRAGASLIQIYTGFVYKGPGLIKKINKRLIQNLYF